jgi:membrane protease YdiL (CAAX protease family)
MDDKGIISRQVVTFFIFTSVISTAIFIWMFNGAEDNMAAVALMMWTPGISAILTSLFSKDKIRSYGWKLGKVRFIIYAYLFPLVVSIVAYGLVWLSGFAEFTTQDVINYKWAKMLGFQLPTPFLIGLFSKMILAFLFAIPFVLGEEIGWSGFITPKLLKLFSVPIASIIVGFYWAIWHYPAIIGGFYGQGTPLWIALPGFTLVCIAASLVRTVLVLKSKNLWVGTILHASGNTILMGIFWEMTVHKGYAGYLVSETGIFVGLVYIIVAVLFWKNQIGKVAVV